MADQIPPEKRRFLPKGYQPQKDNQQRIGRNKKYPVNQSTKKNEEKPTPKHVCGHEIDINSIKMKNCPVCDKDFRKKRKERAKEKKKKLLEEGIKGGGMKWKKEAEKTLSRLPNESKFNVQYDDETKLWEGGLIIKMDDGGEMIFLGKSPSLFKLESELDTQYRKWVKENDE